MKNSKNKKYFPWIILLIVFIFTVLLNYYVQWRCLDSDMASEMVLANLLNKEGALISKNWYYSTEVRVFCEQMWLQLGLLLSPNNWRIARLIGHSINLALLIISFIFLLYSTSIKEKGVWIAVVLLLPFDFWYLFHVLYGGFYICHMIALFVMLGLLLRYINSNKKIYLLLLFVFGIVFGLNGIKIIMYYSIPCLLMLVIITVYKYINNNKSISFYKSLAIGTCISFISAAIGVSIYLFVICKIYTCYSPINMTWGNININNILLTISNYLQSLGFVNNEYFFSNTKILSINGLLGVFGLLNAIVFVVNLVFLLKKEYFQANKNKELFIFIICAFISQTIVLSLTSENYNASYWLPFIPFSLLIIEMFLETIKEFGYNIKFLRIGLLVSFALCSFANNDYYMKDGPSRYEGMQETANWLKERGCKKVIAEFWAGNALAEYSNGEIEVFIINDYGNNSIYYYLQNKNHTKAPLEKDTYVVVPECDELNRDLTYLLNNAEVVYKPSDLIVYRIK